MGQGPARCSRVGGGAGDGIRVPPFSSNCFTGIFAGEPQKKGYLKGYLERSPKVANPAPCSRPEIRLPEPGTSPKIDSEAESVRPVCLCLDGGPPSREVDSSGNEAG